jgi:hypothetical protein
VLGSAARKKTRNIFRILIGQSLKRQLGRLIKELEDKY